MKKWMIVLLVISILCICLNVSAAVDTENKRRSSLGSMTTVFRITPVPDGEIKDMDRRHLLGLYRIPEEAVDWGGPFSLGLKMTFD